MNLKVKNKIICEENKRKIMFVTEFEDQPEIVL